MFSINNKVAITNGLPYFGEITGEYKNGTVVHLDKGLFVVETERIVENDPTEVIQAIDSGKFDIWPLRQYGGRDLISDLREYLYKKLKTETAIKEFQTKVRALEQKWSKIPTELLEEVKSLDFYYDYIDDGGQWRAAKNTHDTALGKLRVIDAEGFYSEYQELVFRRTPS